MNTSTKIKSFFKGFVYAFRGLAHCVKYERNMRFHMGVGTAAIAFSAIVDLSAAELSAVMICIGLVIALECFNTAVEKICDRVSGTERQEFARIAKDCAAGGVLAAAVASLTVGISVFFTDGRFSRIVTFFKDSPLFAALFCVLAVVWIVWVSSCEKKSDKK